VCYSASEETYGIQNVNYILKTSAKYLQGEIDCLVGLDAINCDSVYKYNYCLHNVIHCQYTRAKFLLHVIQCPMRLAN